MRNLKRFNFNSDTFFITLQFVLSFIFLASYFFKKQILYGEAQYFSSWSLWLEKTGWTWMGLGLGAPAAQGIGNNFPVLYIWSFLETIGMPFYWVQGLWFFLLFFLPFLFLYLLSSRVFKLSPWHSFLVASFYIYNPIFLNTWINVNPWLMPIYYMTPLSWLIIGSHWKDNKKTFALVAVAFFSSLYIFANPPYLIIFLLSVALAIPFFGIYFNDKILSIFLLKKTALIYAAFFIVANFIIVSIFLNYRYSIADYEGAVNPVNILKSNSEWSQTDKVFIFRHLFFDESSFTFLHYLMNLHVLYIIYIIPVALIFLILLARKREKAVYFILGVLIVTFFFIKGLNPPFAPAFQYFFEHIPLFNMFKTAPEKFSPLYIFLVSICLIFLFRVESHRVRRITTRLIIVWIAVLAMPVYSFRLIPNINHLGVRITHFFQEDYIQKASEYINQKRVLAGAMSLPGSKSYLLHLQPKTGDEYYLGLDPIINNITINSLEAFYNSPASNTAYESLLQGNHEKVLPFFGIRYLILNKNVLSGFGFYKGVDGDQYERFLADKSPAVTIDDSVKIYENDHFLPKFYKAEQIVVSDEKLDKLINILSDSKFHSRSVVLMKEQNKEINNSFTEYEDVSSQPDNSIIEFKKVNPTKYRVNLHRVQGIVPLVFAENFHADWKIYSVPKESLMKQADDHNLFISKEIEGAVQNDNIPSGRIWDTWFRNPVDTRGTHALVNGYGNMWILDIEEVCNKRELNCEKNDDETYEVSLIVEFWPQRVFYGGVLVSCGVVALCLGYLWYARVRMRKLE